MRRFLAAAILTAAVALSIAIACSDNPVAHDPLAASKADTAIQERLSGHTLRYSNSRWVAIWKLTDEAVTYRDTLDGQARSWFRGPWWVRSDGFYFIRKAGSPNAGPPGIRSLSLEVRGESLHGDIEVVLNGFLYAVTANE